MKQSEMILLGVAGAGALLLFALSKSSASKSGSSFTPRGPGPFDDLAPGTFVWYVESGDPTYAKNPVRVKIVARSDDGFYAGILADCVPSAQKPCASFSFGPDRIQAVEG